MTITPSRAYWGSLNPMPMNTDGQSYLSQFESSSPNGFAARFSRNSTCLDLAGWLSASELNLLYDTAFYAALCNIAFNGLGGCGGQIKPSRETNRISLERKFMASRDSLLSCRGWQALPASHKDSINRIFLAVLVTEDNLAW